MKTINNKQYNECSVVMLATDRADNCLILRGNKLETHKQYFTQSYLKNLGIKSYHLYILSDEEIKVGDWYFYGSGISKCEKYPDIINTYSVKKIILTTDLDLIKDGVQAIDDEFLEWFVNNPRCENTDIKTENICGRCYSNDLDDCWSAKECSDGKFDKIKYKIVIPKEESKQETLTYSEAAKKEERLFNSTMIFKQETLEEAARRYYEDNIDQSNIPREHYEWEIQELMTGFAYKWQQERMYSEEEVEQMINSFEKLCYKYQSNKDWFPSKKSEWFKQFKKKV